MAGELIRCGHCGKMNRVPAAAAGIPRCGNCHQSLPWIADADDTTIGDVADAAKIPVIVDLWAPWCEPCRMVSPALEQLARDLAGRVKLVKVNVDVSPQLSQRFGAQAIPTLLVLREGGSPPGKPAPPRWQPCGPGSTMRSPQPLPEHPCPPDLP
jgi:thioredoxin 2